MPRAELVLVPVDFSEGAEAAARFASALAASLGGRLRLLHVVQGSPPPLGLRPDVYDALLQARQEVLRQAERDLAALAERLSAAGGATNVERVVVETAESVGDAVVEAARGGAADLIVIGTHGRRGLERLFLGSVAERVLRHAHCPVVTVRGGQAS